ncbi:MAG: hypothetical protein MUC92_07290 [Fimbriimonadaceae bacterium]|nr:hypothetical protein [Fimbriimonadaceae bacterium]
MINQVNSPEPTELAKSLEAFTQAAGQSPGSEPNPWKPTPRVPFNWPPHPISHDYHVLASDWSGQTEVTVYGEKLQVQTAHTAQGWFGRVERLWNEARGETEDHMLRSIALGTEPFFQRMFAISATLGLEKRFDGRIKDLAALDLLKLLYCKDRDVANEARIEIEKNASSHLYTPALIAILRDQIHPTRRSAQWCVLDMFEDLPSFTRDQEQESDAICAIKELMWMSGDDYARTIYKAGVVLGGHICTEEAAEALIEVIDAPSRVGRRSAMHAVFHLVEWMPGKKDEVVRALELAAKNDSEPVLRWFAQAMAEDISEGNLEHVTEPLFPEEQ